MSTLEELIAALEAADPDLVVAHGFTNPHSFRGDYTDLAFEPARDVTVAAMLADARSALGATYQGLKGGDYTMGAYSECWLACQGSGDGETIGPSLLKYMLTIPPVPVVASFDNGPNGGDRQPESYCHRCGGPNNA